MEDRSRSSNRLPSSNSYTQQFSDDPFTNPSKPFVSKFWEEDVPTFPNLIHMELSLGHNCQWKSVLNMLNHCPQLQTFVLENVFRTEVWPDTHVLPECFSLQLRKCVFIDFTGKECEMRFVKFVMQNSTSLRTMKIFCKSDDPRSSAACELLFM
ncbi:hypothetical protein P8452_31125 [Trifolium repens]|nr:hypothetical protein P8452_31125 [Trifolium repens]